MVEVNLYALLGLLEAFIVCIVLCAYLFHKSRKARSALSQASARVEELEQVPDVGHYFATEAKLTQGRLDALGMSESEASARISETTWLGLRADYLNMEHEWTARHDRGNEFWETLGERMDDFLQKHGLGAQEEAVDEQPEAPPEPEDPPEAEDPPAAEEEVAVKDLIDDQLRIIDSLRSHISRAGLKQEKGKVVQERIDRLERSSRELSDCVSILESENAAQRARLDELAAAEAS